MWELLADVGYWKNFLVKDGNLSTCSLSLHDAVVRCFAFTGARRGHGT
jgi:hypothetical protein